MLSKLVSLKISLGVIIALRALALGVLKKTQNVVLAHQRETERERERTEQNPPSNVPLEQKIANFWILNEKSAPIVSLLYFL